MKKNLVFKFSRFLCLSSSILSMGLATSANAFQLDFTGTVTGDLTNSDPDNLGATLRFANVGTESGTDLDLLITVLSPYTPANTSNTGAAATGADAGQININGGTNTDFRFEIVENGTTTPFAASSIEFGFFDIDGSNNLDEFITISSTADYTVSEPDQLDITTTTDSITFTGTAGTNVPNPSNLATLSSAQEDVSVNLVFSNTSGFNATLGSTGSGSGRNIFFTSDLIFDDPTITENFQPIPFEFSPTIGLVLSGLGILGLKQFRRQKSLNNEDLVS